MSSLSSGVSGNVNDIPFRFLWSHKGTGNHRKMEFHKIPLEFHLSIPFPVAGEDLWKTELPAKLVAIMTER